MAEMTPQVAAVVCSTPGCSHRGHHVAVHADTVLPLHCGGCTGLLHCDHRFETRRETGGTIGAPVEHLITACGVCGTERERSTVDLDPMAFLRSLPASLLEQPLQ